MAAGTCQLAALAFPLERGQPALGTDDAAFLVQTVLGIVFLGAGFAGAFRGEPFHRGLAVGLGAFVAARIVLVPAGVSERGGHAGGASFLLVGAAAGAALAAGISWRAGRAGEGRAPIALVAGAALLGAGAYAFDPTRGIDLLIHDLGWIDTGLAIGAAAAVLVPIVANGRGHFGAGMVSGGAAVLAAATAGVFAADEGIGFATWSAIGAVPALIALGFVLGRQR